MALAQVEDLLVCENSLCAWRTLYTVLYIPCDKVCGQRYSIGGDYFGRFLETYLTSFWFVVATRAIAW